MSRRPAPAGQTNPLGSNHPRYETIQYLNSGTFGFVQLCKDKRTGEQVAIKFMQRGDRITKHVEREILNHRILNHPHIVKFKEVFLTPQHLAIVMEYAAGGDLFNYVATRRGLSEDRARWFFQQLVVGVDYCHRRGVANRDIKLENTLLDANPRPLLKICDFGYSKHEDFHSAPKSAVGTPAYFAPEVIQATHGKKYDGKTADIWSAGVMLYIMLVGQYPFERNEDRAADKDDKLSAVFKRILALEYDFPPDVKVSPECRDLIAKLLVADPAKRLHLAQIYDHPWFAKDLPPGVKGMNDSIPPPPDNLQTAEDISKIVAAARVPDASAGGGPDLEDYINEAMEGGDMEGGGGY